MRGVAGEEDTADAVRGDLALVAVEAGDPAGVMHAVITAEGEPGQLADLVEIGGRVIGGLAVAVPADDAVPPAAERGDQRERLAGGIEGEGESGSWASRTSASTSERTTDLPGKGRPTASRMVLRTPSVPTT